MAALRDSRKKNARGDQSKNKNFNIFQDGNKRNVVGGGKGTRRVKLVVVVAVMVALGRRAIMDGRI